MIESSYSLYKLIILFMLRKVTFPLTNAQIADLFLSKNYTSYFHLQEVFQEMISTQLIETETKNHTTYYHLTDQGRSTLDYFENEISPEIRREISNYLVLHSYEMRNDSSTLADYFRTSNQDYIVNCMVKEGNQTLIELKFNVPTETAAQTLADNWKKNSQECYAALMK
ncbi:MAG: DUF4364 family protein, partial [Eubacteriales bacterium]|nr:DUF4364 family protein [Eubacteriales bacterium]